VIVFAPATAGTASVTLPEVAPFITADVNVPVVVEIPPVVVSNPVDDNVPRSVPPVVKPRAFAPLRKTPVFVLLVNENVGAAAVPFGPSMIEVEPVTSVHVSVDEQ